MVTTDADLEEITGMRVVVQADEPVPCTMRAGAECKVPAVAWAFWNCETCGRVRLPACLDHLVWAVERFHTVGLVHTRDGGKLTQFIGQAPVKP